MKAFILAFRQRLKKSGYELEEFVEHPELFPRSSRSESEISELVIPVFNSLKRKLSLFEMAIVEEDSTGNAFATPTKKTKPNAGELNPEGLR